MKIKDVKLGGVYARRTGGIWMKDSPTHHVRVHKDIMDNQWIQKDRPHRFDKEEEVELLD